MKSFHPTDDAMCVAAATLAAALAKARHADLTAAGASEQQKMLASYFSWALDTIRNEGIVAGAKSSSSLSS